MAEYHRVTVDENINYEPKLPSFPVAVGVYVGFFYATFSPKLRGIPMKMGLKKYLLPAVVAGGTVGHLFEYMYSEYDRRNKTFAEEYIDRNPEDFQKPPSQKYEEVLLSWNPVRT